MGLAQLSKGPGWHPAHRATGQGPGLQGLPCCPPTLPASSASRRAPAMVTLRFLCRSFLVLDEQAEWEQERAFMPTCAPGRLSPSAQGPGVRVLTCSRWPLHAQLQALCSRSGLSVLLPPKAPASHLSGVLVSWDLNQRKVAPWMAFQALDSLSRCSHSPPPAHHEHPPTGRVAARPPPLEQRNQRKPCSRRRTWALTDQNCRPIVPGSENLGN